MPAFALFLILCAAALHATWNYHLKKAACGKTLWLFVYWITSAVTIPLLLIFDPEALSRITPQGWLVIAASAPIHVAYALILQIGYRKSDYSIVYPTARGTGPLITVLAAVVILGNTPSITGWAGIAAIVAGIVFLTVQTGQDTPAAETTRNRIHVGLFWGTLTGLCIAGYSFCDAWAVQQNTGLTPASFYFPSIALRALIFTPFIVLKKGWTEDVRAIWKNPAARRAVGVVTLASPGGYLLILYAMSMAPLAYVAPTREVGMMGGVIVGALLFHEKLTAFRLAGLAAMVTGVILIAFAR